MPSQFLLKVLNQTIWHPFSANCSVCFISWLPQFSNRVLSHLQLVHNETAALMLANSCLISIMA